MMIGLLLYTNITPVFYAVPSVDIQEKGSWSYSDCKMIQREEMKSPMKFLKISCSTVSFLYGLRQEATSYAFLPFP